MRRAGLIAAVAVAAGLPGGAQGVPQSECAAARLHLAATFYGEAGGQFMQTLTFRSLAHRSCRLAGWPRLVGVPYRRVVQGAPAAQPYRPVLLRPLAAASFDVYGADFDALHDRTCPMLRRLRVALPGGGVVFRVGVRLPHCPGGFLVAPLVPGTRDPNAWSIVWHG